jgi:inosose dehydratase
MYHPTNLTRRAALKTAALSALSLPLLGTVGALAADATAKDRTRGLRLGVATYSLNKLSVEDTIAAIKQLDIKYVGAFRNHIPWAGTAEECRAAAAKFTDAGLTITGCGVIELPNKEDAVRKAFENAKAAGLPTMVCKPHKDAFPLVEKFVKEFDLRLAIHNHGPEDAVYPSPNDAWDAIQSFDKRIGLCIDVGHAARAGTNPADAIRKCKDRLYDVHLKDTLALEGVKKDIPTEVGRGNLDIKGILTALVEIKYTGVVAFEYEKIGNNPVTGLAECVGYVRGMLAGM